MEGLIHINGVIPAYNHKRWTYRVKAVVLDCIRAGLISRADAITKYSLSDQELTEWERIYSGEGSKGLKLRAIKRRRNR